MVKNSFRVTLCVVAVILLWAYSPAPAQKKSLGRQVQDLQEQVKKLSDSQRELEARVVNLERTGGVLSPDLLRQRYLQATKDQISSTILNIGANAYQYRIRPTTMGGGGGTYSGYQIPKSMSTDETADYQVTVFPDSVIVKGTWKRGAGACQATVGNTGRPVHWTYAGDIE